MDLAPLRHEITFGLNRIYLMFQGTGFETTYHVVINPLVIEQCAEEINRLAMPHFVEWRSRDLVEFTPETMFITCGDGRFGFSVDASQVVYEVATVTFSALQIAYYMGFDEVILIGVDHDFSTKGNPHEVVQSTGDDPDHFSPEYFGAGFKWHLPDLKTSELGYELARLYFERHGRRILDATVGGQLRVFPKVPYESLFRRDEHV